jgi:hypothetical protein
MTHEFGHLVLSLQPRSNTWGGCEPITQGIVACKNISLY